MELETRDDGQSGQDGKNRAMSEFEEYLRAKEPGKREKAGLWGAAIGLQKVDGLETSAYLAETARRNIEGEISMAEAGRLIGAYYRVKEVREEAAKTRTDEADIVAQRIAEILAEPTFVFSPEELTSIHRRLFEGIYEFAGKLRDYNITKREWVLKGDTVQYAGCYRLAETLAFDFAEEKKFSYAGMDMGGVVRHVAKFVSGIWQIHAFGEGNTRTVSVFAIKYLRSLGFEVDNRVFAENAWYFRNALVRANYNDLPGGIRETTEFLELFLRNLLFGEQNVLKSRFLLIGGWPGGEAGESGEGSPEGKKGPPASNGETPASNGGTPASKGRDPASGGVGTLRLLPPVKRLLVALSGEMSRAALMKSLGLKDRDSFADYYLGPALKLGLVEMTQPGSPRSPTQKYRLTAQGLAVCQLG